MKTSYHSLTLFILLLMGLSACDGIRSCPKMIWDINFFEPRIMLLDEQGNDLLTQMDARARSLIRITAQGQTFGVYTEAELKEAKRIASESKKRVGPKAPKLRSLGPPTFYGAVLVVPEEGPAYIKVGQYSGEQTVKGEPIKVTWPNGSVSHIAFDYIVKTKCKDIMIMVRYYLDGELLAHDPKHQDAIVITKNPKDFALKTGDR